MVLTTGGEVLIVSKIGPIPVVYVYKDTRLVQTIKLDSCKDFLPKKIIEYKPGKFIILVLQLSGIAYGQSALVYWDGPGK
jgi:hypothetical protein